MRAFVAVEVPDEFRGSVAAVSRVLARRCRGRFVPYENLHVTLAFLGEIGEAESEAAVAALEEACKGHGPVELVSDGLGKFGRRSDATLWLGLRKTPELMGLADGVREGLATHGLTFDEKPFLPHITLARRVRLPREILPYLPFPDPQEATRVMLFRSILSSDGATYKPLHTVDL